MRRIVGMILVGAMALAACSDDSGDGNAAASTTSSVPAGDEYADALSAALASFQRESTITFESVDLAVAEGDLNEAMALAPDAIGSVTGSLDDAVATIERLEPPDDYRADQQTVLAALADLTANLDDTATAAAEGESEAFVQAGDDRGRLLEAALSNLSPTVAGRFAMATTVVDDFPDITDAEVAYLGSINAAFLEFASRNAEFGQSLSQGYSDSAGLLDALLDAGVGTAFAAVLEDVEALDAPTTFVADHDRTVAYLEDAVDTDERVAAAAGDGDMAGFLVANDELADLARQTRLDLSAPMLRAAFPNDPTPPEGVEDDEYELVVGQQMAVLADTFLGDEFPGYRPFLIATDEETTAAIAGVAPLRATWLEIVRSELVALDVPPESVEGHARLLEYVDELLVLHDTLATSAERGDVAATLATLEDITEAWCEAGADLSPELGSTVAEHLGPTATDSRCQA